MFGGCTIQKKMQNILVTPVEFLILFHVNPDALLQLLIHTHHIHIITRSKSMTQYPQMTRRKVGALFST